MRKSALVILLFLPLLAAAGVPDQLDALAGLFPADFVVKDSAEPVKPEQFSAAKLAVVPSTNLENMTTQWVDYNERGGAQRQAQGLATMGSVMGAAGMAGSAAGMQQGLELTTQHGGIVRKASDPRNFTDQMAASLAPYFGTIVAAPDVATALDQKADYVAVIDFYGRMYPPGINTRYRSNASVQLFDASLQRLLLAEGKADLDREGDNVFGSLFNPGKIIQGTADTIAKGIQIPTEQVVSGIREKLGPPPPPRPHQSVPSEADVSPQRSSMGQCIDLCKANTSRTAEQCFDACNK